MSILIETTLGDLVFDLYTEERPRSCLNFLKLCKIKYYNYCLFHSVRRNFIAQCGDPSGSGRGGESIYSYVYGEQAKYFELELKPKIKHKTKGTISFVNNGSDMHGSQFFITLGEGLDFLDGKHTVFGQLAEGFDILEKLNETICDDNHKPFQDVRITHTIILEDPFDDPKGLQIPDRSPEPTKEQLESGRIGADEDVDNKGKSREDIDKEIEEKELKIGTKILETVGDIDDADLAPPENVLFVCKLNPVTNAEDLKIIFSRFGKIASCEIIKDHKTDESLCYGFVEFKEVKSCEKAYFKMDNVLIDDRRIHVDFCQSVAKIRNKWQKSQLYKTALEDKKTSFGYKMKGAKPPKDKYAMVFDDEREKHPTQKPEKRKARTISKSKKYESESEDERPPPKRIAKKLIRKRSSSSSESETDKKFNKSNRVEKRSRSIERKVRKRSPDFHKRSRKDLRSYSSEEREERKLKASKKSKFDKPPKKRRSPSYTSSDSDKEKSPVRKTKTVKKKRQEPSESEEYSSEERETRRKLNSSLKNKQKRGRRDSSTELEKTSRKDVRKNRPSNYVIKGNVKRSKYRKEDSYNSSDYDDEKKYKNKSKSKVSSNKPLKNYKSSSEEEQDSRKKDRKTNNSNRITSKNVRRREKSYDESNSDDNTTSDRSLSPKREKKRSKRNYEHSSDDSPRRTKHETRRRKYSSSDEEPKRKKESKKSYSRKTRDSYSESSD